MTDVQTTAIIGGIVTALPLLFAQWNSTRTRKKLAEEQALKTVALINKTDEIHQLVDGNLSRITSELKISNTKILEMEKRITSLIDAKVVADKVAEKLAEKTQSGPITLPPQK